MKTCNLQKNPEDYGTCFLFRKKNKTNAFHCSEHSNAEPAWSNLEKKA